MRLYVFVATVILASSMPTAAQMPTPTSEAAREKELIITQIKKTVVFIAGEYTNSDGSVVHTSGTGFLLSLPEPRAGTDQSVTWLVTAKHVLKSTLDNGSPGPYLNRVQVAVNLKAPAADGTFRKTIPVDVVDPDGHLLWIVDPDDSSVDLAMVRLPVQTDDLDVRTIGPEMLGTTQALKDRAVNENDEILFSGLFTPYYGARKNYPIVRHGKIALIPEEKVPIRLSPSVVLKEDVYLADVMSFGGSSGSPVFLRITPFRESSENRHSINYAYLLIGVMQGFFSESQDITIQVRQLKGMTNENSGIALIVPAEKIVHLAGAPAAEGQMLWAAANRMRTTGQYATAVVLYKQALEILEKVLDPLHPYLPALMDHYADALRKSGSSVEARALEVRAKDLRSKHSKPK